MTRLTPEQAHAFVSSLPEISGARTPASKAGAAKRTRLASRGIRVRAFELDNETIADLAECRKIASITNRQAIRRAVALLRIAVGSGMTSEGAAALAKLCRMNKVGPDEMADFCYRYVLQEAKKHGRIRIDCP